MKHLSLLCLVLFLFACSKEKLYGPLKLKNGQEVELLVDHRYDAINESIFILPQKEPAGMSLHGFEARKPGYIYRVKARLNVEANPPQDASDRWFNLTKVISEEKYQGNESFDIALIQAPIPGGPMITMGKTDGKYYYIDHKIELTYANEIVKGQLEEIWQDVLKIRESWKNNTPANPKWKSIKATVTHDPSNFGKAYLVQRIEFSI